MLPIKKILSPTLLLATTLLTSSLSCAATTSTGTTATAPQKLNVLFIAVDDLRPELGCYDAPVAQSPHIDALASRSLTFNRAYCQIPLCNPSRISVLTGLRPESARIFDLKKSIRDTHPDIVTLPQLFKQNGYHTRSIGKIFHATNGILSDPDSWTVKPTYGRDRAPTPDGTPRKSHGLPYESPDVADNMLRDGQAAEMAVAALRENADKPFFLAVGFAKPHLPFLAPQSYWDRYATGSISLAPNPYHPKDAPAFSSNNSGELRQYEGIPTTGPISATEQQRLKHGYLACVTYMDAQVGKVLDELDRLGLRDKTVIVLWGDHGYQLGEHGTWTKHTLWEDSARVPLILSDPAGASAGDRTDALVELVDIFPTLTEMCHLQNPHTLEGHSLVPLLKDPATPWKEAAFTTFRKSIRGQGPAVGESIRTPRYRLVTWTGQKQLKDTLHTVELYDHETDPQENVNIANRPENAQRVKDLQEQLKAGWKSAAPKDPDS